MRQPQAQVLLAGVLALAALGRRVVSCSLLVLLGVAGAHAEEPLDFPAGTPDLAPYESRAPVSGTIVTVGSDLTNDIVTRWAEAFAAHHPEVRFEICGRGGGAPGPPPPFSVEGQVFETGDRPLGRREVERFVRHHGYEPVSVPMAFDVLAVVVHAENPIQGLGLPQLDAIFSTTRRSGYPRDVARWGDLGLTGPWAERRVVPYGPPAASRAHGHFRQAALLGGEFKDQVRAQPKVAQVAQAVSADHRGVGYTRAHAVTGGVRSVPIARDAASPYCPPDRPHVLSGAYPLSRTLWLHVRRDPETGLDALHRELLRFAFSREGRAGVVEAGCTPVSAEMVRDAARLLGLAPP